MLSFDFDRWPVLLESAVQNIFNSVNYTFRAGMSSMRLVIRPTNNPVRSLTNTDILQPKYILFIGFIFLFNYFHV